MIRVFLVILLLAGSFSETSADPIIVPFDAEYEPMSFENADGVPTGMDIDLTRALAKQAKIEIEFQSSDFLTIQAGNWPDDWGYTVASMSRNPHRDKAFDFIGPYLFDTVVVVASQTASAAAVEEIGRAGIGICEGCVYQLYLEGSFEAEDGASPPIPGAEPVYYATDPDILRALSTPDSGLKYGITSAFHADHYISIGFPIRKLDPPLYYGPLWIAVRKNRPELYSKLEAAFASVVKDGTLSRLSIKYLKSDYTRLSQ